MASVGRFARAERDAARSPRDHGVAGRMAAALEEAGRLEEALAWYDYQELLLDQTDKELRAKELAADDRAGLSPLDEGRVEALWRALRRYDAGHGLPSPRRPWLRQLVEERLRFRAERRMLDAAKKGGWRDRSRILSALGLGEESLLRHSFRTVRPLGAPDFDEDLRRLIAAFGGRPVEHPGPDPVFMLGDVVEVTGVLGGEWRVVDVEYGSAGAYQGLRLASLGGGGLEIMRGCNEVRMLRPMPRMWVGEFRGTTVALSGAIDVFGRMHSAFLHVLHGTPFVLRWSVRTGGRESRHYALFGDGGSVMSSLQQAYDGAGGWIRAVTTRLEDGSRGSHFASHDPGGRERAYAGPAWILTRSWLFGRILEPGEAPPQATPWSPAPLEEP